MSELGHKIALMLTMVERSQIGSINTGSMLSNPLSIGAVARGTGRGRC